MRLVRVGPAGNECPAVIADDDRMFDLTLVTPDIDGEFLINDGISEVRQRLADGSLSELGPCSHRIGSPIARPGKIICIGLNYRDHANEAGAPVPEEPVVFMKAPNTVIGPYDEVLIPRGSSKTDWEIELAVVIGRTARYLDTEEQGIECVAGYAVSNDLSEREFQLERGGQWDKGKSCETFNPLGPWLVPVDQVPDPNALRLRLFVNGELRQNSSTKHMIFGVGTLVRYLSNFMVLEPGDVINTGTPAGVAIGHDDPKPYLRPGDAMEAEIDGLGRQVQVVAPV